MKKVLVINASVRKERSYSRKLSHFFVENWRSKHPQDIFTYREVGTEIIPGIDECWIGSAFVKPLEKTEENQKVLKLSNTLIEELKENDIYVIATPMYNWSIPSGLKAYIDQIMRIDKTWRFRSGVPDGDYVGLLENKKLFILSSRGDTGYGEKEKNEHMNFQTTYLKFIFGIIGVKDITVFSLDNEEFGGEIFDKSKTEIFETIKSIK
jgi:FMN-dependent NADH-azoreductase